MSEWNAILAGVIAAPVDDYPRLMTANWLRGHGQDDRAEFIEVQCELARLEGIGIAHCKSLVADQSRDSTEPDGFEHERIALREREGKLLNRHGWKWREQAWPLSIKEFKDPDDI